MNDLLMRYLGAIGGDLLDYVDSDEELSTEAVSRMGDVTTALLIGETTPARLAREWPDWFPLVSAFVAVYGWEGTDELEEAAPVLDRLRITEFTELTQADRAFLEAIEGQFDVYPSDTEPE